MGGIKNPLSPPGDSAKASSRTRHRDRSKTLTSRKLLFRHDSSQRKVFRFVIIISKAHAVVVNLVLLHMSIRIFSG